MCGAWPIPSAKGPRRISRSKGGCQSTLLACVEHAGLVSGAAVLRSLFYESKQIDTINSNSQIGCTVLAEIQKAASVMFRCGFCHVLGLGFALFFARNQVVGVSPCFGSRNCIVIVIHICDCRLQQCYIATDLACALLRDKMWRHRRAALGN